MDMEFPRGRGTQVEKSWKFQQKGWGEYREAPWNGKSRGLGVKLGKKNLLGGMDISWNHSLSVLNVLLHKV